MNLAFLHLILWLNHWLLVILCELLYWLLNLYLLHLYNRFLLRLHLDIGKLAALIYQPLEHLDLGVADDALNVLDELRFPLVLVQHVVHEAEHLLVRNLDRRVPLASLQSVVRLGHVRAHEQAEHALRELPDHVLRVVYDLVELVHELQYGFLHNDGS